MEQDSAFYARCRGLSEGKILLRYALPSAVVTLLPNFCQMLGLCMAGSAIVERVFSLPGARLFDYRQRVVSGFTSYPRNNSVSCVFAGNVDTPFGYITADFATEYYAREGARL